MRALMPAVILAILLSLAPAAHAAPTCVDKNGDMIRCGTSGAMPVGWALSPEQLWDRQLSRPPGPSTAKILKVFFGLGLFFAMIALLPDFEGPSAGGGWDKQEGDDQ